MNKHEYSNDFFDYINDGARASARELISVIGPWVDPIRVLDLGCGRGIWLDEWLKAGAKEILGVDGSYIDRSQLAIPTESFRAADLTELHDFGCKFDLAQSLEVGEHLPETASSTLVKSLTHHSNRVLFSAAVPGQGGENHINEKPLQFWRSLFFAEGFRAYDCVRPVLNGNSKVEPWYRYNTLLYANEAGARGLPNQVINTQVPEGENLREIGSLPWRMRRVIVSAMPLNLATWIARKNAARIARIARKKTT
ncbi:MAG: class I SAM-dependent methyltransferase [Boseongicola sp.]